MSEEAAVKRKGRGRATMPAGPGRPKGLRNKRTIEIQRKADELGISPAQVMLEIMATHWKHAQKALQDNNQQGFADHADKAADVASKVAPYIHAKLSNMTVDATTRGQIVVRIAPFDDSEEDDGAR